MPFRISKESKKWFADISNKKVNGMNIGLDIDFDILYFCFISSICQTPPKKKDLKLTDTNELVDYFPGRFGEKGRLLVALFINSELKELGIEMDDRDVVHDEIEKLVDPFSSSYLSDQGMREFNKYVYGGLDILYEWFDYRPRSLGTFLLQYKKELDKAVT